MSELVTIQLPEETAEVVRSIAQQEHRSPGDVSARIINEWVRQSRFPFLEFRSFQGERQACIKDRLQVWQVIEVAKSYDMEVAKIAEHLGLSIEQVQTAIRYYQAYPEEIDTALRENEAVGFEQIKRLLPGAKLTGVELTTAEGTR